MRMHIVPFMALKSRTFVDGCGVSLKFTALHLVDGVVAGSGCHGHVGKGGVLTTGRTHEGAVRDEEIGNVVGLVVSIEDGGLGVVAHAGAAHLVDALSGDRGDGPELDVGGTGRFEHLSGGYLHVAKHGELVFTPFAIDVHGGDAPGVDLVLVYDHVVVMVREALSE